MAKRQAVGSRGDRTQHGGPQPLRRDVGTAAVGPDVGSQRGAGSGRQRSALLQWSSALLAALLVYVACWPVDSVALEQGEALYACLLAIAAGWLAWLGRPAVAAGRSLAIDAVAGGLALWVVISIWGADWPLNRRMAINEAWLWVAGAATFTAVRRCCAAGAARRALVALLVAVSVGLAVHAWHQQLVSLPRTRAAYEADPQSQLDQLGLQAPPGSAARMMFENRLYDGGPTATFSLANSLAAPLLLGCLFAAGLLIAGRDTLARRPPASRPPLAVIIALGAAALITASILWATHSRSAVLAAVLGLMALALWRLRGGGAAEPSETSGTDTAAASGSADSGSAAMDHPAGPDRRWAAVLTLGGLAAIAAASLLVFMLSERELLERAPASVAFRLQYWRATWAMALDAPWFGCGPGNFQSRYELYRELAASEQIAEPHNFVMETLAAGGFPAVALLGGLMSLVIGQWWREPEDRDSIGAAGSAAFPPMVGAAVGLLGVWVIGFAVRNVPDLEAHLWAVPAAAGVLVALRRWIADGRFSSTVGMIAVAAVLIHLLAAGGWTVAGIAVGLWIASGMLAPVVGERVGDAAAGRHPAALRGTVAVLGALLLMALYGWGIRPVAEVNRSMELAGYYLSAGRLRDAEQTLQQAAAADRWDPRPTLELASLYGDGLLQNDPATAEHRALRQRWQAAVADTLQRSPAAPVIRAAIADRALRAYQRWGQSQDLQMARQQYQAAAELAPANERWAAQLAVVLARSQRAVQARQWAERAEMLSAAGGHVERQLHLIPLLVAEVVGPAAAARPITAPAAELIANLKGASNVSIQ